MSQFTVSATYWIETPLSLNEAAEMIATEQSTGTFVALPGETRRLKDEHRARVASVCELGRSSRPALPGALTPDDGEYRQGRVTIDFAYDNIGPSIPNLLATVAGNLFELKQLSGIRLADIEVPRDFLSRYRGPGFGISGTRAMGAVFDRPIIGTIIKPSIGLAPDALRRLVRTLAEAGVDFIKDDEVNANPPYLAFERRFSLVMEELIRARQRTGKQVIYAANITDDLEQMLHHHDVVVEGGGNCIMVSINSVGWAALQHLRQRTQVPIHGHRNQWGALTRYPGLGMDFLVYQKLCRLVGVDHLHTNGLSNKFYESDQSVQASVRACLTPWMDLKPIMPVLSSGQWAGLAGPSYQAFQTVDLMHLAGGGIMAHPGGVAQGVASMRQGWEAALASLPAQAYASSHPALAAAIKMFGRRSS